MTMISATPVNLSEAVEHEGLGRASSLTPLIRSTSRPDRTRAHRLSMRGLELDVRLGCTTAERATPQRVSLDITIHFDRAPRACTTDALGDTICMQMLAEALAEVCRAREFALVEYLTEELLARALELVPSDAECELEVCKLKPPIAGLTGGFAFRIQGRGARALAVR